jgi:hypothetical protein
VFPLDLFPQTVSSWIFLIVACLSGFFIGQWIRHRRKKKEDEKEVYAKMLSTGQKNVFQKRKEGDLTGRPNRSTMYNIEYQIRSLGQI